VHYTGMLVIPAGPHNADGLRIIIDWHRLQDKWFFQFHKDLAKSAKEYMDAVFGNIEP
jgi:hypothetical protein